MGDSQADRMSAKVSEGYQPPEHFRAGEKLPPVVQEAAEDNTELWLIRIPANEIGGADLQDKSLKLKVDASDGVVGHFSDSQGREYNIIKHDKADMVQPYAVIPNDVDPFVVRKVTCQVGFVRAPNVQAEHRNEQHGRAQPEQSSGLTSDKEHGRAQPEQSSGLTSDKEQSVLVDTEKPSKKKRRRSEPSEKN